MNELKELQGNFLAAMAQGAPLPALQNEAGLAVYREGYCIRLGRGLEEDFPVSLKLLPAKQKWLADFFRSLPSATYTLNALGQHWLHFLRQHQTELPDGWLELAEWEWELVLVLYRDSAPEREEREIQLSADPPVALELAPAFRLLASAWPLAEMYAEETLLPDSPSYFAFWRAADRACYLALEPVAFYLLSDLAKGRSWPEIETALEERFGGQRQGQGQLDLGEAVQAALAHASAEGLVRMRG